MKELDDIKAIMTELAAILPNEVDRILKNSENQTPLKVSSIKGALIHRLYDLSCEAVSQIERSRFIPSMVTIRAVFETMALIYLLNKKVSNCLKENSDENLNKFLERLILGSRNSDTEVSSYNILNAIDEVSKKYENCRNFYDDLSEYSHPNFAGVQASYSYLTDDKSTLKLGLDPKPMMSMACLPLNSALIIAVNYFNELGRQEKEFHEFFGIGKR